jgi:F-type H+-transporting ATPase subunit b
MIDDPSFWYLISFTIFVGLMIRPLIRLSTQAMDDKIQTLQRDLEEARQAKAAAEKLLQDMHREQKRIEKDIEDILTHAKAEIKQMEADAKEEVSTFRTRQETQLSNRIRLMEKAALRDLQTQLIASALASVKDHYKHNLEPSQHQASIQGAVNALGQSLAP